MAVKGSVEITLSLKKQQQTLAAYRKVETKLKKSNEAIENSFNKASTSAKNADRGIKSLTSSFTKFIPAAIGVGTALVGAKKAFDFSKEFARFDQSTKAMEMQFGVSSDAVLEKLGKVAKGTISNAELISSANRAMALNVTKDLDQMAKLMEVARIRGQAMGLDTTQAFSDLVTGIGRASPLILDNLGIITKGWDKQAKAAGRAMDASFILDKVLSDGQTMLKKTGDVALTNAEKFQLMEAQLSDLRIELGEKLLPVVLKVTDKFNKMIGSLLGNNKGPIDAKAMSEGKEVLKEYIKVFEDAEVGIAKQGSKYIDLKSKMKLDELKKEYANINKEMASIYPIEEAKEWLELSDRIDKNLKQFTPTGGTKKYPGGLSKPELKKTSLAEEKKKEISSLTRPDMTEEIKQGRELSFQIRELEIEAQAESMQKQVDLVQLKYEKERDIILNQEAINGDLRKALVAKEEYEIAEIEKQFEDERINKKVNSDKKLINVERQMSSIRISQAQRQQNALSQIASTVFGDNLAIFAAQKALAIGQTLMSGFVASSAAVAPPPLGAGPILGIPIAQIHKKNAMVNAALIAGLGITQGIKGFEYGGRPPTDRPSLVGEGGPELFVPDTAGTIIPNNQLSGFSIETVNINIGSSTNPQETAATIEETLHNIKDQSMRMSTI